MSSPPNDAVQSAAPDPGPPAETIIPLAPIPPAAPDHRPLVARLRFLDGVLALFVVAFAFIAACTRLSNPDLLLHLATGRLIAQGQFPFVDPFTFTAGAWINQSWLFDLLLYTFHSATGPEGEALTVLKALGFAGVAWLILRAGSKPGERLWISATCTLLAALAISPRSLALTPLVASLLVLAGLVGLMARHEPGSKTIWAAPALCLLWANLDAWFFLGPLLMGLFLAGRALDLQNPSADRKEDGQADLKQLALVAGACLLACLVNPFLWNAFLAPPPELARFGAGGLLAGPGPGSDPQFRGWHLSLWDKVYYNPWLGLNPAGLSIFPLAFLSLASFGAAFPEIRWWRVLAWLATLALALLSVRAVPLFAVVAGPVMALNFLEASTRRLGPSAYLLPKWRTWAVSGRVLTVFIALSVCVLSVPGWLQAVPHYRYRVGLGIEFDEGLRAAALQANEWREQGALPGGQRWFNLSPETTCYFAWFCPGERMFLDQRLVLFDLATAQDFLAVRNSLMGQEPVGAGDELSPNRWRRVFADRELRWIVFHAHTMEPSIPALFRLYSNPDEWTPCFAAGKAAIFSWRGTRKGKPFPLDPRLPADFNGQAFGPKAVIAPDEGPNSNPPVPWYSILTEEDSRRSPSSAYAHQQLCRFGAERQIYMDASDRMLACALTGSLVGRLASCAGTAGAAGAPALAAMSVRVLNALGSLPSLGGAPQPAQPGVEYLFVEQALRPWMQSRLDMGPPSAVYLGIRAAREAIKQNPLDPSSRFLLSELYTQLSQRTRELSRINGLLPHMQAIRQTQIVAPLVAILQLNPDRQDRVRAHGMLANAFNPNQFLDLRVHHLEEYARQCRAMGFIPGVPPKQQQAAGEGLEKHLAEQRRTLAARRGQFEVKSLSKPTLQRAALAQSMGLVEEAITILTKARPEEMAAPGQKVTGLQMLVTLLLGTGRVEEARGLLFPPPGTEEKFDPSRFGVSQLGPAYDLFLVQMSAGSGDYATSDMVLRRLTDRVTANPLLYRYLAEMDVLPESFRPAADKDNLAQFIALAVGDSLLRASSRATNRPGDFRLAMPLATHPPHRRAHLPWMAVIGQSMQIADSLLAAKSDLLAIRASLALELGRMAEARDLARQALDLGGGLEGMRLRSSPYAALILELAEGGKPAIQP